MKPDIPAGEIEVDENAISSSSRSPLTYTRDQMPQMPLQDGGHSLNIKPDINQRPRTSEDFYLFCQLILEHEKYNESTNETNEETNEEANEEPNEQTNDTTEEACINFITNKTKNHKYGYVGWMLF